MKKEEKGMVIGMYFAKFEELALQSLGFQNFMEAFNVISLITKTNPNSLRNYRDEFAPAFPTKRLGWHKRKMHPSRKQILSLYFNLDLDSFTNFIKDIIYQNKEDRISKIDEIMKNHNILCNKLLEFKNKKFEYKNK